MKNRQKWTDAEDEALLSVMSGSPSDWVGVSRQLSALGFVKNPKQICERWKNVLDPKVDRSSISSDQVTLLFQLQDQLKTKWSLIAEHFPHRTDNAMKNKFFSLIRFALRRANRLVRCFSSTRLVNSLKPKAILNFLDSSFPVTQKPSQLPFSPPKVSGREFVLFFISLNSDRSCFLSHPADRELVTSVLDQLTGMNKDYIDSNVSAKTRKIKKLSKKPKLVCVPPLDLPLEGSLHSDSCQDSPQTKTSVLTESSPQRQPISDSSWRLPTDLLSETPLFVVPKVIRHPLLGLPPSQSHSPLFFQGETTSISSPKWPHWTLLTPFF